MGLGDALSPLTIINQDTVNPPATINVGNTNLLTGVATVGSVCPLNTNDKATGVFHVTVNSLNVPLSVFGSIDGLTWIALSNTRSLLNQGTAAFQATIPAGQTGVYTVAVGDFQYIRLSTPTGGLTGSATVIAAASSTTAIVTPDSLSVIATGAAVGATSGNVANAAAVATIAASAGQLNYLSAVEISYAGATAAGVVVATVVGLATGTRSLVVDVPLGATAAAAPILLSFNPPLPASAVNTAIVVTLPALGAGNTNAAVNASGWRQ